MVAIFTKLRGIFLNRWDDQFSTAVLHDQAIREWALGLVGLSGDQIAVALAKCRTDSEWPPSIAKFRKFAMGDDVQHIGQAYKSFRKALPKPINRELAKSSIANLKAICGTG